MSHSRTHSTSSVKYDELRYLPMLVGAISPISIIMSLPPLTGAWIAYDHEEKPTNKGSALTTFLSVAVLLAMGANLCLLFRFMEKRIVLNTIISVIGYTLHAAFMFVPIGYFYFTVDLQPQQQFTGDFWAGVCVSGISLVLACLLIVDYFQNNRLRLRGSGLSSKQRTLVFFCIFVTLWSTFGALVFSLVEEWSFTRGVYFTLVTMTTIGFGDYYPKLLGTRIFLFPYAIVGIVAMGILINSIRIVIIERFESIYLKKLDDLGISELERYFTTSKKNTTHVDPNNPDADVIPFQEKVLTRKERIMLERKNLLLRQLHFSVVSLFLFWVFGALIFMLVEKWTYFDAFYFCFVSFTTVGYGDVTLKTFEGIVVFIGYALLGLVAAAYVISVATELWSVILESRSNKIEKKHRAKAGEDPTDSTEHMSQLLLSALETIDQDSGSKDLDLLCHFVGITRLYHSQIAYHLEDCEEILSADILDSPRYKNVERYHEVVTQLLEKSQAILASQIRNASASHSQTNLNSATSTQFSSHGPNSDQIELLQRRNTDA